MSQNETRVNLRVDHTIVVSKDFYSISFLFMVGVNQLKLCWQHLPLWTSNINLVVMANFDLNNDLNNHIISHILCDTLLIVIIIILLNLSYIFAFNNRFFF